MNVGDRRLYPKIYYPSSHANFQRTPEFRGRAKFEFTDPLWYDYKHAQLNGGFERVYTTERDHG